MKTYRVKVVTRILEFYEVEADSPEEAEEFYCLPGRLSRLRRGGT